MNQLPLTGNACPETSHEAEARHVASGKLAGNKRRVLALVCRWPGKTAQEYFELCIRNERAALIMGLFTQQQRLWSRFTQGMSMVHAVIEFARLRAEILRRLRDLDGLDLIERMTEDGKLLKRGGACVWTSTWRGTLENKK